MQLRWDFPTMHVIYTQFGVTSMESFSKQKLAHIKNFVIHSRRFLFTLLLICFWFRRGKPVNWILWWFHCRCIAAIQSFKQTGLEQMQKTKLNKYQVNCRQFLCIVTRENCVDLYSVIFGFKVSNKSREGLAAKNQR